VDNKIDVIWAGRVVFVRRHEEDEGYDVVIGPVKISAVLTLNGIPRF